MKYLPSKRVIWLMVPLMPVLLMAVVFWFEGESTAIRIATRGAKPPEERLLARPLEWYDEGVSAVMGWEMNPWNYEYRTPFGSNFHALSQSKDPQDQEKYRNLMKLGREWYERLLVRYPELVVTYRNLPEEQNGLLQWYRFEKRQNEGKQLPTVASKFSTEIDDLFHNAKFHSWEPVAARTWLDANRAILDEARAIALMRDQSSLIPAGERLEHYPMLSMDCARAFLMEARLRAEQGDADGALDSLRAVRGLARHFGRGEAPSHWEASAGDSIQATAAQYGFNCILPSLSAGRIDLAAWEEALCPDLQQPGDFSRRMRGEWNITMRGNFLANLADSSDPSTPTDAEFLAEEYTRFCDFQVRRAQSLVLTDLPSMSPSPDFSANLKHRSRVIAKGLGMIPASLDRSESWERMQMYAGKTRAAFAILKGERVPVDPIHGMSYPWDPATRELAYPAVSLYAKHNKTLVVPKPPVGRGN